MKKNLNPTIVIISVVIVFSIIYLSLEIIKIRSNEKIEFTKLNQNYREYVAQRIFDCYQIEASERTIWGNINHSYYELDSDTCWVSYQVEGEEEPDWRSF